MSARARVELASTKYGALSTGSIEMVGVLHCRCTGSDIERRRGEDAVVEVPLQVWELGIQLPELVMIRFIGLGKELRERACSLDQT